MIIPAAEPLTLQILIYALVMTKQFHLAKILHEDPNSISSLYEKDDLPAISLHPHKVNPTDKLSGSPLNAANPIIRLSSFIELKLLICCIYLLKWSQINKLVVAHGATTSLLIFVIIMNIILKH